MYQGKLVFATTNEHKLKEARHILSGEIQLLSLKEINCLEELPETHPTLEENAFEKAHYVFSRYQVNCFSEDTGLEVDALGGAPGVYSARFAGEGKHPQDNIRLLLAKLSGAENRKARFRTVISLILNGKNYLFEAIVNGMILTKPVGESGFGYDPVFVPDGYNESFAQMNLDTKSQISHRRKALDKLAAFLKSRTSQ